jgi:hypothetical protein
VFVDFSPIRNNDIKVYDMAMRYTAEDLRAATNAYFDALTDLVEQATDDEVAFIPHDPHAHDPYAKEGEEHIGWSLGHLVVHVTASLEENATYSSILARGLPYPREPRLRYETPWQTMTTRALALQRLAESRRICLSYLDAWPDTPNLDTFRDLSERYLERFGPQNAPAAYLMGLKHMDDHMEQFRDVFQQARAASEAVTGD